MRPDLSSSRRTVVRCVKITRTTDPRTEETIYLDLSRGVGRRSPPYLRPRWPASSGLRARRGSGRGRDGVHGRRQPASEALGKAGSSIPDRGEAAVGCLHEPMQPHLIEQVVHDASLHCSDRERPSRTIRPAIVWIAVANRYLNHSRMTRSTVGRASCGTLRRILNPLVKWTISLGGPVGVLRPGGSTWIEFRLPGDVEVQIDGGLVDLSHARQRCAWQVCRWARAPRCVGCSALEPVWATMRRRGCTVR
jgi:hypothetical protein